MPHNFDEIIDRRHSDSTKWNVYPEGVLPLWTADMDFRAPAPILDALRARAEHGVFGYCREPEELRALLVERLARLYGWRVRPEDILLQTGVLVAFQQVCAEVASTKDGVLVLPPVYPPIYGAPRHNGSTHQEAPLRQRRDGSYEIDFDALDAAITDRTRVLILCNPHNPVGRAFTRPELERLAETCLRRHVVVCSDEIHCDLLAPGVEHVPVASMSPDIARNSVTLMAPSKTFNVPGLRSSFAVVPDAELRRRLARPSVADFSEVNNFGLAATIAAYRDGQPWLDELLAYLEGNRRALVEFIRREMPQLRVTAPEATYLAWIDCRESGITGNAYRFFLDRARVALSDGPAFGTGGEGFVRLNFGCPRATLMEALGRMKAALDHPGA
jgi:cystathionine beta-lyase